MGRVKDWIFYKFFRAERSRDIAYYEKQLASKKIEITNEADKKTVMYDIAKSALNEGGNIIVGVAQNKNKEEVLVVQRCHHNIIWFKLYGKSYEACRHPRIMATYQDGYMNEASYIKIDDILTIDKNIGNGSILMPYFLEYCKATNAVYISGELSSVDSGHFDRSIHFYEKHGFVCTLNEKKTSGGIRYILKNVSVVAAVINKDDKIFVTQRGYGEFKDGWEFPGGKVEAGETSQGALVREIKEELDIEIEVHELIDIVEYDYPAFHLSMQIYWCSVKSGKLVLKEHKTAKWLTKHELGNVDWIPADKTFIDKLLLYKGW